MRNWTIIKYPSGNTRAELWSNDGRLLGLGFGFTEYQAKIRALNDSDQSADPVYRELTRQYLLQTT